DPLVPRLGRRPPLVGEKSWYRSVGEGGIRWWDRLPRTAPTDDLADCGAVDSPMARLTPCSPCRCPRSSIGGWLTTTSPGRVHMPTCCIVPACLPTTNWSVCAMDWTGCRSTWHR